MHTGRHARQAGRRRADDIGLDGIGTDSIDDDVMSLNARSGDRSVLRLTAGRSVAEIHPAFGGRLGQLDLGDGPLLRAHAPDLGWTDWGCYPLAPWSNRLPGGRLRYRGIDSVLPPNHADGSAIHGLVAACRWDITASTRSRAELEVRAESTPYSVAVRQLFELDDEVLRIALRCTNEGDRGVPMGLGIHPWFHSGPIRVPADRVWPGEPLPTGPPQPPRPQQDLRQSRLPEPMDACFTALTGSYADAPGCRLHWEGPVTHVVVYSGAPGWVCIEPVTMANDGIRMAEEGQRGHGVIEVQPGDSMEVRYRFERR